MSTNFTTLAFSRVFEVIYLRELSHLYTGIMHQLYSKLRWPQPQREVLGCQNYREQRELLIRIDELMNPGEFRSHRAPRSAASVSIRCRTVMSCAETRVDDLAGAAQTRSFTTVRPFR